MTIQTSKCVPDIHSGILTTTTRLVNPPGPICVLPQTRQAAQASRLKLSQKNRLAENEAYLKNQNVKAFLVMIGKSEGGDYHAKYGWHPGSAEWTFTDESTQPGFGYKNKSTASGLYQINKACWMEHGVKAQGLSDFSPYTQDLIAVETLRYRKAMPDVLSGNLKAAIDILKPNEWVSFQVHSFNDLNDWYTTAGGK